MKRVYNLNEKRIVTRFAFFPISAGIKKGFGNEVRWLELCRIHQTYEGKYDGWKNNYFVDDEQDKTKATKN